MLSPFRESCRTRRPGPGGKDNDLATVLVVDDDPLSLAVARGLLARTAHRVLEATERESCLRQLFAERVAVVVMDVHMPGTTGDELAEVIQRNLAPCPRVVLCSGLADEELRTLAERIPAHAWVTKEQAPERLVATVEEAVRAYEDECFCSPGDLLGTDPGPPPERDARRVLVVEDCETRRFFLADWFRERGLRPHLAPDGRAALELLDRLPDRELPTLMITDLHMPRLDGSRLIEAMRGIPRLAGVETILYSTSLADAPSYALGAGEHARDLARGAMDFDELLVLLEERFPLRAPRSDPAVTTAPVLD